MIKEHNICICYGGFMRLTDEEKDMFLSALAREMKVQLEKNNRDLLLVCKNLQEKITKSELWRDNELYQ